MKRYYLLMLVAGIVLAAGCGGGDSGEFECNEGTCYSGDARYTPGEDFDGVATVDGDLSVDGVDNIDGLSSLEIVSGNLVIVDTDLTDLEAFSNLTRVDGEIHIAGNDQLENLSGLEALRSVPRVEIRRNGSLTSLDGLAPGNLTDLKVVHNPRLRTFGSLNNIGAVMSLTVRYNVSLPCDEVGVETRATNDVIFNQPGCRGPG